MATLNAITAALAVLHEAYPTREITPETARAWQVLLADISDTTLAAAVKAVGGEPGRSFFPTPGELLAHCPNAPRLSAMEMLRQITALGHDGPHFEWVLPTVECVRAQLGDGIAAAYGEVGPHRLGSENPLTREIAERDFATALQGLPVTARAAVGGRIALSAPDGPAALVAGDAPADPPSAIDRWYAERAAVSERVKPPE